MSALIRCSLLLVLALTSGSWYSASSQAGEKASLLFLGDQGPHRPYERFQQLAPVLRGRGIDLTYTDDVRELNPESLAQYDGLVIYANITRIEPDQETALLDFVASGKGFIPLHCATYCFLNSDNYIELCGAQFKSHTTGIFRTDIVEPNHPVMKGFGGFRSWDETYVHHRHNEQNRTVLEFREQDGQREPWTWVRTHGKGRVFYTAWGHDQRTWSNPGFQNLVERGIRWAIGQDPAQAGSFADRLPMTELADDSAVFEYLDVGPKIPNYTPGRQWGAQGEAFNLMQKPLPPEKSQERYVTPVDFELKLFVSEPDLQGKPIAMSWDERGRLWVCETYDYPNELQSPGQGRDRIRICEDTDHDGRADKFTVFAGQLSIPTSIAFWNGGAIVQNGTQTLYLKDTDGDDVADERTVLFDGWALGDTHGGVSNFQYGLDNWIYAMQGYNNSSPTVKGVEQQSFRMGFFRFKPDGSEIEFLRSTNNNTWGLGITEEGLIFGSTANHNPSDFMAIPNRYYERVRGWAPDRLEGIADTYKFDPITDKIRQVDQFGGYTAGAGHAVYTARTYPEYFWNRTSFVCGPTGHLVGTFLLNPDGAGFQSTSPMNLVASDDEWSAPIMAEVGPDGNVWILDWYNYIVQHNPTPQGFQTGKGNAYESDLRDKKHGRIYRLVYKKADKYEPLDLTRATPEQLVATLRHPTMLWRKHAQRLLVERGETDVVLALERMVADPSVDAVGLNAGAIHAIWALHGLGALDAAESGPRQTVLGALQHPSAGVRRNALQALPKTEDVQESILASGLLELDSDPQVRLAALLALADGESRDVSGVALAELTEQPATINDRWLRDALTSAAAAHAMAFLPALGAAETRPSEAALAIVGQVSEHLARGRLTAEQLNALLPSLQDADMRVVEAVLSGLNRGWPRDHTVEIAPEAEEILVGWLNEIAPSSKGELVRLASAWGSRQLERYSAEIVSDLLAIVSAGDSPLEARLEAARQAVRFRVTDDELARKILDLVTPQTPPELADGLLAALGESQAPGVGRSMIAKIASMTPAAREAALRVLLSRPQTTRAYLEAVQEGHASLGELSLDQKQLLAAHPDRGIRRLSQQLLQAGGGLPNPDRQKVLQELLPLTEQTGDPEAGKAVLKKHCLKCHQHRGEGERIGPDLTGMAVHPKRELLGHIIDPSKDVEGNFRIYTVVTDEGRVYNGLLASETRTTIELFDAEAKKHVILREEIEELVSSRKSLMPEGFEKQVKPQEIVDLLEFMTHKGKYLPIPIDKVATVVSTQGMFFEKSGTAERMIFPDWSPKTFEGVPFYLVDPRGERVPNTILLYGPNGNIPPQMPKQVSLDCNTSAKAIHMLSGVSGWGFPIGERGSVSMIVRLHYADGTTEDHELKNGIHFADYIRRVDVPESKFAFQLRSQQIRYLAVEPEKSETISRIELIKGDDQSSPIVMAVTVETR
ncbi:MAG TPA: PVC-type heme-binding CxxCH protein [Planctomycetaceae bacterium]|nr:PVC-type heme-binding CxxCH protein [Planctomycetaceae bacterium]